MTDRLQVDFLYLDLETCTRCRETDRSLESALEAARDLLAATGTRVEVNRIHVTSAEEARRLRFESSPTIRLNGRDIALELRESPCGSEPCTDGCGESIACRVWVHEGKEYTEPPLAMVLDAVLREVYGGLPTGRERDARPYELPENLERFFAGRAGDREPAAAGAEQAKAACCQPAELESCCEPGEKAECCGAASEGACGCH